MVCHCGSIIDDNENIQIELRKKLEWLRREDYIKLLEECCTTCLQSMLDDINSEIEAMDMKNLDSYRDYSSKFKMLPPDSIEYQTVADRFHQTVNNKILRIESHNNPVLYDKYQRFKDNHKGNEKLLFHGSRHKNYVDILDHGFDINLCRPSCMQGIGIYFATNASYSINGYAEAIMLENDNGDDLYRVGNMLCCHVYATSDTGVADNNYCIRNADQCYPSYIIYYTI